jgi:nitroimidazol reductase NimA-like FMN-containing flavoprotein (pyridoxamine 5'-phosphate oxidase superfamily)
MDMTSNPVFCTDAGNRVSRIPERASYDKEVVFSILDACYFCHIGFVADGKPVVIPMTYWRRGEYLYFHSASKGRFADACVDSEICITVTSFDGLVLGHSAFNHSYNYRSVVIHGTAERISDFEEKVLAMKSFVDHVIPHRWDEVRPIRDSEVKAITLMRLKLDQVSAKIRDEFPDEEMTDPNWPVWVGVIPAKLVFSEPIADPERNRIFPAPAHIAGHRGNDKHKFKDAASNAAMAEIGLG